MRLPLAGVRRALVVAPHPDDEAIGAWGVIRQLRRRGVPVRVVVASEGAASHPGSLRWPRARLVAERRRETRAVLRRLGVTAGAVRFLALPDGGLPRADCRSVTRAVVAGGADLILLPCADDAHPDHRAVAQAAARARTPGARRWSYRVWPPVRETGAVRGHPIGSGLAKRTAIRRYGTQMGRVRDDPRGFAIAAHELRAFCRPFELFRRVR
jgi:LmbE family N-acetylglucosaminyl deacetylase